MEIYTVQVTLQVVAKNEETALEIADNSIDISDVDIDDIKSIKQRTVNNV